MFEELRPRRAIRTDGIIVEDECWLGAALSPEGEDATNGVVVSFHRVDSIGDRLSFWKGGITLTDRRQNIVRSKLPNDVQRPDVVLWGVEARPIRGSPATVKEIVRILI
ncbi:hypothetical protein ACFQH2_19150 [Natronoarchaeum sp. GCM10025703]|uniref:hypothetical protein n=1 Tax=unclassified Natronoarchaeum TaxID=2620183 RepID=UPI003618A408